MLTNDHIAIGFYWTQVGQSLPTAHVTPDKFYR
jgi:hypothetical protein